MAKVTKLEMLAVMLEMLDAVFGEDPQVTYSVGTWDFAGQRCIQLVIRADIHNKQVKINRFYETNLVHIDQIRQDVSDCIVKVLRAKDDPSLIE